jgi:hypothetical protein
VPDTLSGATAAASLFSAAQQATETTTENKNQKKSRRSRLYARASGVMVVGADALRQQENSLPKYLCLQRNLPGSPTGEKPSPAQMQAMYATFNEWKEKFQKNLTDMGGKLGASKLLTSPPALDVPPVEVKTLIGGYMIVSAASIDEAAQVARECPGLVRPGSGVEVIEIRSP